MDHMSDQVQVFVRKFPHSLGAIRGLGSEKCRTKLKLARRLEEDCNRTPDNFPFHFDMTGLGGYSNLTGFCEKDTRADPRYEPTVQLGVWVVFRAGSGRNFLLLPEEVPPTRAKPNKNDEWSLLLSWKRVDTRWFEIENFNYQFESIFLLLVSLL